ncbi:transposase [Deinococcus psychrotolerans]|uniref:Transposase n=1 Tax=Deinococcus psychrotolerans TaxID=2489213 RepID=A0A3G8YFB9_9DEIO|nr:transposase [Deinococcus psychrotolerans]AZI44029.1 transposase [Deinococcus psychrotolerans]
MGKQRKKWPTDTKEQIVLSVLGGQLNVAEAARQHGVNESLIHTWKAQFLEAGRGRLAGDHTDDRHGELERENERLKVLVGEKELALHIAKKARGL